MITILNQNGVKKSLRSNCLAHKIPLYLGIISIFRYKVNHCPSVQNTRVYMHPGIPHLINKFKHDTVGRTEHTRIIHNQYIVRRKIVDVFQ